MLRYAAPIQKLIEQLEKLPGIGPKSAQRLAFFLLRAPQADVQGLGQAVLELKGEVQVCRQCYNYCSGELCPICADPHRDRSIICVVEEAGDLMALERAGEYQGIYHVLGGALSPVENIKPSDLHTTELIQRIKEDPPQEVILATSPTVEGDATAEYVRELIQTLPDPPQITRIALGLPVGGDLDYADQVTLARALRGRTVMED